MDKDTILDYVTETPGNTNRAVLGSMLDSMGGSGESEMFIVTFSSNNNEWSADKTLQEIYDAWNSGKRVFGTRYAGIGNVYFPLTEVSGTTVTFSRIYDNASDNIFIETFALNLFMSGVLHKQSQLMVS